MFDPSTDPSHAYFRSLPWCASLMKRPGYKARPFQSRTTKDRQEDSFFGDALRSDEAITAAVAYEGIPRRPNPSDAAQTTAIPISSLFTLFAIGTGLNGHPNTLHGGMVACLFDETMGMLIGSNQALEPPAVPRISTSTAYLNTTYLKRVPTPVVLRVTAWLVKYEGRKVFIDAAMEDETGVRLAKCEALFVVLKQRL